MAPVYITMAVQYPPGVLIVAAVASLTVLCALVFVLFSSLCCCFKPATDKDGDETAATASTTGGGATNSAKSSTVSAKNSTKSSTDKARLTEGATSAARMDSDGTRKTRNTDAQSTGIKDAHFTKNDACAGSDVSTDKSKPSGVKDRITMFETSSEHTASGSSKDLLREKDPSKPRKKKPTSKAFQEFETKGILIGFGRGPCQRSSSADTLEEDDDREGSGSVASLDIVTRQRSIDTTLRNTGSGTGSHSNSTGRLTDDEGIHTMDEEDEFAAVARNSEVLKSFRRAPPPKNRSKAHRPLRQRIHGNQQMQGIPGFDFPLEKDEDDDVDSGPTPSQSLDSISTPASDRQTPDNEDTATSGHMTGEDSPRDGEYSRGNTPEVEKMLTQVSAASREESPAVIDFTTKEVSFNNASTLISPTPKLALKLETEVFKTPSVVWDQSPVVRPTQGETKQSPKIQPIQGETKQSPKIQPIQGEIKQSTKIQPIQGETKQLKMRSVSIDPEHISHDLDLRTASREVEGEVEKVYTSTSRVQLKSTERDAQNIAAINAAKPRSFSTGHAFTPKQLSTQRSCDSAAVGDTKLTLTRPRSFHPSSFTQRYTPTSNISKPSSTPKTATNQQRVRSMVGGATSEVLRKWESELSGLDSKRRKITEENTTKDSEVGRSEVGRRFRDDQQNKLQAKWETAI